MNRKALDRRLQELSIYSEFYHRKELNALAQVIGEGETLNCILTGVNEKHHQFSLQVNLSIHRFRSDIAESHILPQQFINIRPVSRQCQNFLHPKRVLFSCIASNHLIFGK